MTAYENKVCEFLEKMPANSRYRVDQLAAAETRENFIAAAKLYMRSFPFQGYVTFNYDYTEIYKTSSITFKK